MPLCYIFDAYGAEQHGSHGALAAHLNERGTLRRGRPWGDKGIRDILGRGAFYSGYAVYRRGEDVRPGIHERIITPEQRHLAERVAFRRRRPGRYVNAHRPYALKGLVYCGCGRRMRGETLKRPGRAEYRYYRCPSRRDRTCDEPNVRAEMAEGVVIEHLARHVSPPELIAGSCRAAEDASRP